MTRLAAMDRRAIPDHQQLACDLAQQQAQEPHDIFAAIGMVLHLHQQPPIRRDATDGRQMVARQLDPQYRRLPDVGPRCAPPSAADKSPIDLSRQWSAVPRRLFFERGPLLVAPGGNRLLVALGRSLDRLLDTQAHGAQEAADMGRMIADAKGAPDDLGHALGRPDLAAIAVGFGSWCQQAGQVRQLLGGQLGRRAWWRMATQRLHAAFTGAPHPLADRAFGDAQRRGDVLLLPALLFQFPGPSSSAFEPI